MPNFTALISCLMLTGPNGPSQPDDPSGWHVKNRSYGRNRRNHTPAWPTSSSRAAVVAVVLGAAKIIGGRPVESHGIGHPFDLVGQSLDDGILRSLPVSPCNKVDRFSTS